MSYSFQVKAATKAEAKAAVAAEFDKVVEQQPTHAQDKAAVIANANAVIDLLVEDDAQDVGVSCNGYVSWVGVCGADPEPLPLVGASISANAYNTPRG